MSRARGGHGLLLLALFASFCAGVAVDEWLRTSRTPKSTQIAEERSQTSAEPMVAEVPPPVAKLPVSADQPAMAVAPADQPTMAATPVATIEARLTTRLRVPIDGISIESLKGGFSEMRGDRVHEAVDIIVPRGTPIRAVQNGTIAKLFFSRFGGITIYEFEDGGRLCFYYAHLQRYADDLREGQHVSVGEVIGYVGTTGNAPPGTPHLHFEIHELNADRKWWQGRALDPYLVFKDRGED